MGKVDDSVQTKASADPGMVKRSDLRNFYEQGHSPQEVADEFNVEVETVLDVLDLRSLETKGDDQAVKPAEE